MRLRKLLVLTSITLFFVLGMCRAEQSTPTDDHDVFIVKVEKEWVGAKVEVFSENGSLVTAQQIDSRKLMIDFSSTELGVYTIRLTKGDQVKEFLFEKT